MRTHQGNVGAILKDVGPVTFEQLERYEIPYHGKLPDSHVFIKTY